MTFRDEMQKRYSKAHDPAGMREHLDGDTHNYAEADRILSILKDDIRAQVDRQSDWAEGQTTLGIRTAPKGFRRSSDLVIMDEHDKNLDFFHSYRSASLTKKGRVVLRDLDELARLEGISLDMALCYQGALYPLEKGEMAADQPYLVLHRHRLTQSNPSIQIRYSYRVA